MSAPSANPAVRSQREEKTISPLLDAVFGFLVWAIHLLAIYIATALACVLGLGTAAAGTRMGFLTILALVTVVAAASVVLHALRRYRQQRAVLEQRFRMSITIGCDAIAAASPEEKERGNLPVSPFAPSTAHRPEVDR